MVLKTALVSKRTFATAGNKLLATTTNGVGRSPGTVKRESTLHDAAELAHKRAVLQIPKMHALVLHVHKCITASVVQHKRDYWMVLSAQSVLARVRAVEHVSTQSTLSVGCDHGPVVWCTSQIHYTNTFPLIDYRAVQVLKSQTTSTVIYFHAIRLHDSKN